MSEIKVDQNEKEFAEIKNSDTLGKDEIYWHIFECPKCKGRNIVGGAKFCIDCGIEIKWVHDKTIT